MSTPSEEILKEAVAQAIHFLDTWGASMSVLAGGVDELLEKRRKVVELEAERDEARRLEKAMYGELCKGLVLLRDNGKEKRELQQKVAELEAACAALHDAINKSFHPETMIDDEGKRHTSISAWVLTDKDGEVELRRIPDANYWLLLSAMTKDAYKAHLERDRLMEQVLEEIASTLPACSIGDNDKDSCDIFREKARQALAALKESQHE